MIGEDQKDTERFVTVSTKITNESAEILNRIAKSRGIQVYELLQLMCQVLVRSTSDRHNLSDEISRLLTLFHSEPGWKNAYNICNPTAESEVAQEVVILQQPGKKGFGAVMVDKPYMGQWTQTMCVDDIVERIIEVCMPGVYRRIRRLSISMECESITDLLITLTDAREIAELEESDRKEMEAAGNFTDNGREYKYGARTKVHHHRTPDGEAARQQRLLFPDIDHETGETMRDSTTEPQDFRPFGEEW